MKLKLEEKLYCLQDLDSPYYGGSGCLLSVYVVVEQIKNTSHKDFKEAFPELEKTILKLFDEDTILFALSKKNGDLMDEEWQQVINTFDDYAFVISELTMLEDFCFYAEKKRYLSYLKHAKVFLSDLARMNLEVFTSFINQPIGFARTANDVFVSIKKENRYEQ